MTTSTAIVPVRFDLEKSLLPEPARRDFDYWCDRLEPLLDLRRGVEAKLRDIAAETGTPFKTVRNKFYAAKKNGLTALVDKRLAGPRYWNTKAGTLAVDEDDQELVKLYCELNQRSSRAAVKQLRRDWVKRSVCAALRKRLGAEESDRIRKLLIKTRALDSRTGMPRGWSIDNLSRYAPEQLDLKSARIGRTAAASERQLVYTGRKGLWVGSHYMLDDMWHDFFVNSVAEGLPGRPLELFSHDLYSARKVRWGVRIRTRRCDGSYNQLTERMTRLILAATLYLDGYSPRGTVIVAEHGTAAVRGKTQKKKDSAVVIREGLDKELFKMSGGLITVDRSGMEGAAAHAGQYPGLQRGNPRMKASLESSNNLTHNVFAQLPAQTGKDLAHRPEELGAMLDNNRDLLIAARYLSPERAALLEYPLLSDIDFHTVAHELYRAIEDDPDHDLDDWAECGNTTIELEISPGNWMRQEDVIKSPEAAALARALIGSGHMQTRERRMTRGEVWRAGAGELISIGGSGVWIILGDDLGEERTVSGDQFGPFRDQELGPGKHRYNAVAVTPRGERVHLAAGESYRTVINPFAPEIMFVGRTDGSYIGECARITKPCRNDVEAVERRQGEVAKAEKEALVPFRKRHLGEAREMQRRMLRNAKVAGDGPITPEEQQNARVEERASKSAARFGERCAQIAAQEAATTEPADSSQLSTLNSDPDNQEEIKAW